MRGTDYVLKRTVFALVTVFVAITLNFLLFRALPGDAVSGLRCRPLHEAVPRGDRQAVRARQVEVAAVRHLPRAAGHGDLGTSTNDNRPVWDDIKTAAPEHAADGRRRDRDLDRDRHHLGGGGRLAARHVRRHGQPVDGARLLRHADAVDRPAGDLLHRDPARAAGERASESNTLGILSTPSTWAVLHRPRRTTCSCRRSTLGIGLYGEYSLVVRSSMLETLGEDYVLTARAKGLRNWAIVWKHALRNAMLPLVTLIALSLGLDRRAARSWSRTCSRIPGIGLATIEAIRPARLPGAAGHLPAADAVGDRRQLHRRPALLQARPAGDDVSEHDPRSPNARPAPRRGDQAAAGIRARSAPRPAGRPWSAS